MLTFCFRMFIAHALINTITMVSLRNAAQSLYVKYLAGKIEKKQALNEIFGQHMQLHR